MKKLLKTAGVYLKNIQQIFWHNYCRCCKEIISNDDEYFCSQCWSKLGLCLVDSFCTRCGREAGQFANFSGTCPKCEDETYHFDSIACAGIYNHPLSELIVRFKLADQTLLLPILSDFSQKSISRAKFSDEIDYFTAVPIHWRTKFKRGFNQSELIAKNLKIPNIRIRDDLVRIRFTKSQTRVTFAERQKNLVGAFAVRKGHDYNGKNVCLIDDVKTTGATLNECAKVLKDAGAQKVFAFVLAVASQGK